MQCFQSTRLVIRIFVEENDWVKKDHLVEWKKPARPNWIDKETYDQFPDKITIREVAIRNDRKGYRACSRIIVTTLLMPKEISKNDLVSLYGYRWHIELDLRSIKETMQMGILRGKTPEMVHKEMWAHILAYNLIRKVMAHAEILYNKQPRVLSFKLTLQLIEAFRQSGILFKCNNKIYFELLKAISYKKVGNRPGRMEPRRIKRSPKPFPRLQKARYFYHLEAA